jgi:hypothetical protein
LLPEWHMRLQGLHVLLLRGRLLRAGQELRRVL